MDYLNRLKEDRDLLVQVLGMAEPSLLISMDETMAKVLLLAGASHLEHQISEALIDFVALTSTAPAVVALVHSKAVNRQYHTLFNWDGNNANSFFALFGTGPKSIMQAAVAAEPALGQHIRDFLKLGSLRNQLVHGNYASFSLSKTCDEIVALYRSASLFAARVPSLLLLSSGSGLPPALPVAD